MSAHRRDPTVPGLLGSVLLRAGGARQPGTGRRRMRERLPIAGSDGGDLAAEARRRDGEVERRPSRARLMDAVAFQRRPLETLARRRRTGGPLFPLTSAAAGPMLVVGAPELAHEVLYAPPGGYLARAANRRILPVLPEHSVLTLDGDPHRQRRR